jgi:hypothetical protein
LIGTARYSSITTHMGLEQSRRDDLESICYVMLYFLRGSLPWQGLPALKKEEKYRKIMDSKIHNTPEYLCKSLPGFFLVIYQIEEIKKIFKYCKELPFEETPDYNFLYESIESVFRRLKLEYDFKYNWLNTDEHINKIKPLNFLGYHHNNRRKSSEKITLSETYEHKNTNMNENLLVLRKKTMQLYFYSTSTRNAIEKEEREEGFLETWCCFM